MALTSTSGLVFARSCRNGLLSHSALKAAVDLSAFSRQPPYSEVSFRNGHVIRLHAQAQTHSLEDALSEQLAQSVDQTWLLMIAALHLSIDPVFVVNRDHVTPKRCTRAPNTQYGPSHASQALAVRQLACPRAHATDVHPKTTSRNQPPIGLEAYQKLSSSSLLGLFLSPGRRPADETSHRAPASHTPAPRAAQGQQTFAEPKNQFVILGKQQAIGWQQRSSSNPYGNCKIHPLIFSSATGDIVSSIAPYSAGDPVFAVWNR